MDFPKFKYEHSLKTSLEQRLMLSQNMQQALHVLTLPLSDLSQWVEKEVLENPILELVESSLGLSLPLQEHGLSYVPSLYEILMEQARERIPKHIDLAERIIGNLDEKGFFCPEEGEFEEESDEFFQVLSTIQSFEPKGVGARNPKEALLIQLKGSPLASELIENHYEAFIHQKYDLIASRMGIDLELVEEIVESEIRLLDPFPGLQYHSERTKNVVPEMVIEFEEGEWLIKHPRDHYPSFRIRSELLHSKDPIIKKYISSGKWLADVVMRRKWILEAITKEIIRTQESYLLSKSDCLNSLTMKSVAEKLDLNESTLSRALADKYIETPLGLLPFSHFFCRSLKQSNGKDVSIEKAKKILKELIDREKKPLPDELLAKLMEQKGIPIARRTVSKYRKVLGIPSARNR